MPVESRSYESPLRVEQRERTRIRILDAAIEQLADEGLEDLRVPLVARKAGVSVRTVYVHFPTKDALVEAVAHLIDERIGSITYPQAADELPSFAVSIFEAFDRDERLYTAATRSKAWREVSARRRGRRIEGLETVLDQDLAGLEPNARREALAAIYVIHNMASWRAMKDNFGLTGPQAGAAAAWAVHALLRELRRSPGKLEGASGTDNQEELGDGHAQ
jgi:AcrR family transcriptional regulator